MSTKENNQVIQPKFEVRFDRDAAKEYGKLSQPVLGIVNKSIEELEVRADVIGKNLGNKRDMKLAGCKEIKLREAGIRIIYRVTNETVDVLKVVYILTIEKRSDDFAFKLASQRLRLFKRTDKPTVLSKSRKWEKK